MALDRFGAETFILLKKRGTPLRGVLTFGRQHFSVPPAESASVPGLTGILDDTPELISGSEPYADAFFRSLGTETLDSLDASDYESCSRIHDLNEPIPESWHGGYDVVFDGGTLEHVFHFPNAIANAMNFVKPGGVLITQSPSNNLNGHGFYQFSPELFFRLFNRANGFRILLIAFVESDWPHRKYRIDDPESIGRRVTFGGHSPLQMIVVATRETIEIPLATPPYQSDYSATWSGSEKPSAETTDAPDPMPGTSLKQQLRRILPAGWVRKYEHARSEKRRKTLSIAGIREVKSLDECWQGLRSGSTRVRTEMATNSPG